MIVRGWSVRVHASNGEATNVCGVVTRVWTNEATHEQYADVAAHGQRWCGPVSRLKRIELQRATLVVVNR